MQGEIGSMVRNRKQQTRMNATPGFAIEIKDDTELGLAMLIAEDEEGHYLPVGSVININEGREIAQSDLRRRMRQTGTRQRSRLLPVLLQDLGRRHRG